MRMFDPPRDYIEMCSICVYITDIGYVMFDFVLINCGSCSVGAVFFTQPLDLVKNRMQMSG